MKKTDTQKVILTELSMTGVFHSGVNAGFIQLMREVYPSDTLRFTAEKSHIEACRTKLNDAPVHYQKFPFFPRAHKWTLPLRDLLGSVYAAAFF